MSADAFVASVRNQFGPQIADQFQIQYRQSNPESWFELLHELTTESAVPEMDAYGVMAVTPCTAQTFSREEDDFTQEEFDALNTI